MRFSGNIPAAIEIQNREIFKTSEASTAMQLPSCHFKSRPVVFLNTGPESGIQSPSSCLNRVTKSHYRSTQIDLAPIKLKPFASTCDAKTRIVWTMYIETTRNCSANNPANAEWLPNSKVSVFQEACHLLSPPPL